MLSQSTTLASVLLLIALQPTARAQCAEWTEGFGVPGTNARVEDSLVYDDGSGPLLYFCGVFDEAGGYSGDGVATWDGSAWSSLGLELTTVPNGARKVFALEAFDKGNGKGPRLYIGGQFNRVNGVPAENVARWNGKNWTDIGTPGDTVYDLAGFDDGTGPALYAGGSFGGQVRKWDGVTTWAPVGGGFGPGQVSALEVFDDGTGPALYAAGTFSQAGGTAASNVARWDGTSWTALGTGLSGAGWVLEVHDDGTGPALYAGGQFQTAGGSPANHVARWDGTAWSPLGTGASSDVLSLRSFGSALYVGGNFSVAGSVAANHVAVWDGLAWSALAAGTSGPVLVLDVFDHGAGPLLYGAGAFATAGNAKTKNVAQWNGAAWSAMDAGLWVEGDVEALATFDGGAGEALYAGGAFLQAGEQPANNIARWDGAGWSDVAGGLTSGGSGAGRRAKAFATFDDGAGPALFVGGRFHEAGGLPASHIARWDGTGWSALGSGLDQTANALVVFDDGSGPALFVGGKFDLAGGSPAPRVAKWDGASWSSLGFGPGGDVLSLAVFDDGDGPALFAGGGFLSAGGVPANRIAKWNGPGAGWSPLASGVNNAVGVPGVDALAVFDEGAGPRLFAAGAFRVAGGVQAHRIARWDGSSWSALGALGLDSRVLSLGVWSDGSGAGPQLYVGGKFDFADGLQVNRLARWDGAGWSALDAGLNRDVRAIGSFEDPVASWPSLFVGGTFGSASNASSGAIARWANPCACQGTSYCTAGTTASGCNASMSSVGAAQASSPSGFLVTVTAVEGQKDGAFYFSTQGQQANPWGNGSSFQCVAPPVQRTGIVQGNGSAGTCQGVFQLDFNAWMSANPHKAPAAGETAYLQCWFRDPLNTSNQTTSLSDALTFSICP